MAQNITLMGASYQDVPSVELPKTGGGTALFTDVSDSTATAGDVLNPKTIYLSDGTKATGTLKFNWIGKNPEYLGEIYSISTTLDDTPYATWTPSTTALAILPSVTLTDKVAMDLENYEYVAVWVSDCNVAYKSTWTASKGSPLRSICMYSQSVFRKPTTDANATAGNFNTNSVQQNSYQVYWNYYWSSASAKSLAYTTYSPAYISSVTAFTFSSTTANVPNVTIKTPVISSRCSTTYFTTANAGKIDQENTTVGMKGYLYRVAMGTSVTRQTWEIIDDVWINGL